MLETKYFDSVAVAVPAPQLDHLPLLKQLLLELATSPFHYSNNLQHFPPLFPPPYICINPAIACPHSNHSPDCSLCDPFITLLLTPNASALRPQVYQKQSEMVKVEDQAGKPVWDKPVDVDEKWIQFVDDNVLASKSPMIAKPS